MGAAAELRKQLLLFAGGTEQKRRQHVIIGESEIERRYFASFRVFLVGSFRVSLFKEKAKAFGFLFIPVL